MTDDPTLIATPVPDLAAVDALRGSIEAIVRAQFEAYRDRRREDSASYAGGSFVARQPDESVPA